MLLYSFGLQIEQPDDAKFELFTNCRHGPFVRSKNAILQTYIMVICCPMFLVNFFHYFGQRRGFFPPGGVFLVQKLFVFV